MQGILSMNANILALHQSIIFREVGKEVRREEVIEGVREGAREGGFLGWMES